MKIKSRFTKVAVASGLIVMSGAAVLGITSIASAQVGQQSNVVAVADAADSTNSTVADGSVSSSAVDGATDTTVPGATSAPKMHADRPSPLVAVAKVLNMTEAELKAELVSGKSVADIAKAKNIDIDTVIAALTRALQEAMARIEVLESNILGAKIL